jgi:hypothetical protein
MLHAALREFKLDRCLIYVTHTAKHFKHKQRGKRRIHKHPNRFELEQCRSTRTSLGQMPLAGKSVLIIEDEPLIAMGVEFYLQDADAVRPGGLSSRITPDNRQYFSGDKTRAMWRRQKDIGRSNFLWLSGAFHRRATSKLGDLFRVLVRGVKGGPYRSG